MTFRLGLTGGIGMGKSTTVRMFADRGVPVWDADAAVHRLYAPQGAAVAAVITLVPAAAAHDGSINRAALKSALAADPALLPRLEAVVHPLLRHDRAGFLAAHPDAPVALFDIPLLFETGADADMDGTATVSVDAETQRARVLSRGTMDEAMLNQILSRQLTDAERRTRARWVIPTDTPESALAAVDAILQDITHA
ncbi:MAG: dephospho-CoA kinase [Paracoccus sp. (in: a-proteobacteria)]|uniref:dephospho-CoA kinase n=1 Tax=Paracoccus sp. TaxID=267 RepID=UPI0026E00AF3|nr:dephospho-CoA kinase [Paracoccus sp. (in: a-proteobacteria)]MDO5612592.1 dephospho-CoA kinase [Paracoccus sp. (in: a-proteobacteria)]